MEEVMTTSPPVGRTVVGVDGSAGSLAALDWAVKETRLRGGVVHVVVAWLRPQLYAGSEFGLGMDPSLDAGVAAAAAAEAGRVTAEAGQFDELVMTSSAVEGHPAHVLLEAAEGADMLVVGSRGHGGFLGALLGSVSQHVVAHCSCPVVVVPAPGRTTASA
jgi:nucleotide-binding universal stress UspA family protein